MKKLIGVYVVLSWVLSINLFATGVDCSTNCFQSEIIQAELLASGCTRYEILVTANDDCAHALSHYTVEIPKCAEIKNVSSSISCKVEYGFDPTTGIRGFKIDNISNFGESAGEFTVSYTLCEGCCSEEVSCYAPKVAYKAATCVYYEQIEYSCNKLDANLTILQNNCANGANGSMEVTIIDGAEPFSYSWSNGATTSSIESLVDGNYSVIITDANNESLELFGEITSPEAIAVNFDINDASCSGNLDGSIDASITGGTSPYTTSWSNGESTEDISGLNNGYYVLTISDANGCTTTATANIENTVFININGTVLNTGCSQNNGSIDLDIDGGQSPYTYSWTNGSSEEDLSGLAKGQYSVIVTDANGCTSTRSFTITENNPLRIAASTTPTACVENNSGAIDITMIGGQAPYVFLWSNGESTEDITSLALGIYSVTVTDATGCSVSSSFNVTTNTFKASSLVTQPNCAGSDDGRIELLVSDGTAPYSYVWSTGETSNIIENLVPGPYSVTIEDAAGCSKQLAYYIYEPQPLIVSFTVSNPTCNEGDFEIIANASGGTAPFTYNWSNGTTGSQIVALDSGFYSVTVTDTRGCSITAEAQASFTLVMCDDGTGDDGSGDDGSGDDGSGDDGSGDDGSGDDGSGDDGSGDDGSGDDGSGDDGSGEDCYNPFDTEIELIEHRGDCYTYKATISYNGNHVHGLSHWTVDIACGSVGNIFNSEHWAVEKGKDPTTGLHGFKIDNINGFGEGSFTDEFEVEFTICTSDPACIDEMEENGFTVAYKYGQCVNYDDVVPSSNCGKELKVNAYPNPFYSTSTIEFFSPVNSPVQVDIINRQGVVVKQLYTGSISENETKEIKFDATGLPTDIYTYKITTQFGITYGKILLAD